jgi:hypothetical protein
MDYMCGGGLSCACEASRIEDVHRSEESAVGNHVGTMSTLDNRTSPSMREHARVVEGALLRWFWAALCSGSTHETSIYIHLDSFCISTYMAQHKDLITTVLA